MWVSEKHNIYGISIRIRIVFRMLAIACINYWWHITRWLTISMNWYTWQTWIRVDEIGCIFDLLLLSHSCTYSTATSQTFQIHYVRNTIYEHVDTRVWSNRKHSVHTTNQSDGQLEIFVTTPSTLWLISPIGHYRAILFCVLVFAMALSVFTDSRCFIDFLPSSNS